MENVILIIHLLIALTLIAVVLLQRSEGGGLGIGGGGGGGLVSARGAATALGKLTWILATAFIITSLTLTILARQKAEGTSVIDRLGSEAPVEAPAEGDGAQLPILPGGGTDAGALVPPSPGAAEEPVVPPAE